MRVRERGRAMDFPEEGVGMTRRLAISTTSLPLNFFSSSRTSRCCTLWNAFSSLYGTCSRAKQESVSCLVQRSL